MIEKILIIIILLLLIISIYIICQLLKRNIQNKNNFDNKLKQQLQQRQNQFVKELYEKYTDVINQSARVQQQMEQQTESCKKKLQSLSSETNNYIIQKQQIIDENLKNYYKNQNQQFKKDFNIIIQNLKEQARLEAQQQQNLMCEKIKQLKEVKSQQQNLICEKIQQLKEIKSQIDQWKSIQNAINYDILQKEQKQKQQQIYSLQLTQQDKSDINLLIQIAPNFKKPESLYKLIWSEYLLSKFNSMIKLQFGTNIPSNVIYCIQNKQTQKKYIGKTSAQVSKRWTEHIKTSLNIGTVSRSKIHDALFAHWDEFTFTVLQVVDKSSSLSERQKWYINFYESNIYGYNVKSGG